MESTKKWKRIILTVHRYGSASIRSDHNLVFAIQESIEKALVDAGIENKGGNALKDATIAWLSDKDNKNYFNGLITGTYSDLFGGDDADTVIEKLRTFSGEALARIMDNIFKVADERQVKALSLSVTDLGNWIREVIRANSLKAIVFMWDEFTEYFYNNARNLTGFQELCEISETDPFYFVLVTHVTQGLFHERDQDFIKLNGRFVSPHSLISLPENIAFQLMGAAMEKNKDEVVLADWEVALGDLTDRTQASRKLVKSVARITDKEMIDILPIHPYAALLLKHISSAFDSNQRSMFDFIKNDRGDEIKGFQWFIDNFGPEDDNPLLSVDMLWEFFYDKGKEYLSHDIRSILDYYNRAGNQRLDSDQKRVLKTVLLLQAISQYAGDSVELFIPNEKNLDNAFEGTDMEGSAARCADQLVREKVLFSKSLGGGKFQYAAYNHENEIDVTPFEEQIDRKSTSAFITEELADRTRIVDAISLGGALKLRYELRYVSSSDFDSTIKQLRNTEEKYANKIVAVVCFAKDDAESVVLGKKIHDALAAGTYNMIFIDASRTPFGADGYGVYRHDMALSMSQQGKDPALVTQYANNAKDSLKKWKTRIAGGEFMVHTADKPDGERATTLDALYGLLAEINKKKFVSCLEGSYNVIANMYTPSSLKQGVECAFNEKTAGTFLSGSPATKLEIALDGAWKVPEYWLSKPHLLISKIKLCVDEIVNDGFQNGGGRVSIKQIYNNQVDLFNRVCGYYLDGLSEDEIKDVFDTMPAGSFTYEKADYLNQVEAKVGAYKEGQKNTQLKKLWREKTGTDSPRDWSKKHKMPILCLIPDNEVAKAKAAFGAVNRAKADEQAIDRAMEYFASAKFFDLLDDSAALDKAFRDSIIGNYAVMLLNIQEVKDYLDSHITAEPFEWFGLPEIEKKLRQMAEAKYNQGGCERALAKIDEMDIADVKKYLKDLIRDNMVVGMEIIKGN